jgi:hypothetical protein
MGITPNSARAHAAPFAIRGSDANAVRGIAFGCVVSALLWAGLGVLVRAALG